MAILSFDDYIASYKQNITISKTSTITTTAANWHTGINLSGIPSAGAYGPSNVVNGVVPVAGDTGYPLLEPFAVSAQGYLSRIEAFNTVVGQLGLYDILFIAGPVTIPTTGTTVTTLTSQPSFTARLPEDAFGNPDWATTELWAWPTVAWSNHAHSMFASYRDQDDNDSVTPTVSTQNRIVGRTLRLPFADGDNGCRRLNGFTLNGVTSATGSVNVAVVRRIWQGRIPILNTMLTWGPDLTGMPEVFANSAFACWFQPDSSNSGTPQFNFEIASK